MARGVSAQERIGERRKMNDGMCATLIGVTGKTCSGKALYLVRFEDGATRDGIRYDAFKKGQVAHPKDKASGKIGECKKMNNGMYATILEITGRHRTCAQYKVKFEDGAVVDSIEYRSFKNGHVTHPNDKVIPAQERVGECKKMKNGMYATIIEISGKRNTTALYKVQFEDGAVREGIAYKEFKLGHVAHPKDKAISAHRIGERRKMNNGLYATILEITGKNSVGNALYLIRFDDGATVDGVNYNNFKKGNVAHPKDKAISAQNRIGECRKMNNGLYATILKITGKAAHGNALYRVQFEDGATKDGVFYDSFRRGKVAHPNDEMVSSQERIGERRKMNNGLYATILEITGKGSNNSALFKVQFEDGVVVDGVKYSGFKQGYVAHPKHWASGKIGDCREMNNGMQATIIEITGKSAHKATLFKIQFEDGAVVDGIDYGRFKKGSVAHPTFRPDAPKGERDIAEILTAAGFSAGVGYIWEYSDENFVDKGRRRHMDFYIPELKLFIEFNGRQHFEYIPFYHDKKEDGTGGRDGYGGFWAFAQEKAIDDFKWRTCKSIGCELWYFADDEPYTEGWRYPVHTIDELLGMLAYRIGEIASKKGA